MEETNNNINPLASTNASMPTSVEPTAPVIPTPPTDQQTTSTNPTTEIKKEVASEDVVKKETTTNPGPISHASIMSTTSSPIEPKKDDQVPSTPTPTTPIAEMTPAEKEIADKLERAKLAMEGPARTAVREEREHDLDVKSKLATIDAKLAEIAKQKEALEITWIKLDENRTGLRKMIDPIVERETKLEVDESQLEEQEKNTVGEKERMTIEQKRWAIQEDRHKAEEEKWVYDSRLFKVEDQIKDNTSAYQKILDEETALLTERDSVERSSI